MAAMGLLIEYEYCSGCHSCEMACQVEHGFDVDRWGIKLTKIGPWHIEGDQWEYDFIPNVTDLCDMCAERTAADKLPSCVHHCQGRCMYYGDVIELAQKAQGMKKSVMFVPKSGSENY